MDEINYDIMRYELDSNGYISNIYFGCASGTCAGYQGAIPSGYDSLEDWAENANIKAYKIVNGNLVYDAQRDAELQTQYEVEAQRNANASVGYVNDKINQISSLYDNNLKKTTTDLRIDDASEYLIPEIIIEGKGDLKTATNTIEDARKDKVVSIEVEGKSYQETSTQSANILDLTKLDYSDSNLVGFTINDLKPNEIKFTIDANNNWRFVKIPLNIKENGKYTCTFQASEDCGTNIDSYGRIYGYIGINEFVKGTTTINKKNEDGNLGQSKNMYYVNFDVDTELYDYYLYFYPTCATTTTETITFHWENLGILKGGDTYNHNYVDFTPNSPSPDYPKEIKTVKGVENNLEITSHSQSEFDGELIQGSFNGIGNNTRCFNKNNIILEEGEYILINDLDIEKYKFGIFISPNSFPTNETNWLLDTGWLQTNEYTFEVGKAGYFGINLASANGIDVIDPSMFKNNKIMLVNTNNLSQVNFNLNGEELCSIGDVKDELVIESNRTKKIKRIGKVVLDGSEKWEYNSTYNYFRCPSYVYSALPNNKTSERLCSHFKVIGSWTNFRDNTTANSIYIDATGYKFSVRNTDFTVVEEFKQWLSENNVTVYYVLETPIEHTLNYEILELHEGYNNITTNDELKPDVDVTYISQKTTFEEPIKLQISNSNLLTNTGKEETINGLTFVPNEDGTVYVSGTATADVEYIVAGSMENTTPLFMLDAVHSMHTEFDDQWVTVDITMDGSGSGGTLKGRIYSYDGTDRELVAEQWNELTENKYITCATLYFTSGVTIDATLGLTVRKQDDTSSYVQGKSRGVIDIDVSELGIDEKIVISGGYVKLVDDEGNEDIIKTILPLMTYAEEEDGYDYTMIQCNEDLNITTTYYSNLKIGGFNVTSDGFTTEIFANYDYTEEDYEKLNNYLLDLGTLTDEEKIKYDLSGDGKIMSNDSMMMRYLIDNGITTTNSLKFVINNKEQLNKYNFISIINGNDEVLTNIGSKGITTNKLTVGGVDILNRFENTGGIETFRAGYIDAGLYFRGKMEDGSVHQLDVYQDVLRYRKTDDMASGSWTTVWELKGGNDYVCLKLSANHTIATTNTLEYLKFTRTLYKGGNRLSVTSDGKVKVGAGVSMVKISVNATWIPTTVGLKYLYIYKNDTNWLYMDHYCTATQRTRVECANFYMAVTEGDIISIPCYGTAKDVIDANRTFLTIEAVE